MSKKNFKMTPEERAKHDFAVKVRKMTDEQLYNFVNAPTSNAIDPSEVVNSFINLCAEKGRRMGPATICCMKMVAAAAGYEIGV